MRTLIVPVLTLLLGGSVVLGIYRTAFLERLTAPREAPRSSRLSVSPPSAEPGPALEPHAKATQLLQSGRLREAQDVYLEIITTDPRDEAALQGLVVARRYMAGDNSAVLRRQAGEYWDAIRRGVETDEHYSPRSMETLLAATLQAVKEIEHGKPAVQAKPPGVVGPQAASNVPASPPKAAASPPSAPSGAKLPASATPPPKIARPQTPPVSHSRPPAPPKPAVSPPPAPSPPAKPAAPPAQLPASATPAKPAASPAAASSPPATARDTEKSSTVPAAHVPPAPTPASPPRNAPGGPPSSLISAPPVVTTPPSPPPSAPATQTPAPSVETPVAAVNRLYTIRIGPLSDRDLASALVRQLSAGGFSASVSSRPGFRVLSEPLPLSVAEGLAASLTGRGIHTQIESLGRDTVHLVFGSFSSQKEAEALSQRISAQGYDAWVRDGTLYTLQLGPYPQPSLNTISGIVRSNAPGAAVATDPVP